MTMLCCCSRSTKPNDLLSIEWNTVITDVQYLVSCALPGAEWPKSRITGGVEAWPQAMRPSARTHSGLRLFFWPTAACKDSASSLPCHRTSRSFIHRQVTVPAEAANAHQQKEQTEALLESVEYTSPYDAVGRYVCIPLAMFVVADVTAEAHGIYMETIVRWAVPDR